VAVVLLAPLAVVVTTTRAAERYAPWALAGALAAAAGVGLLRWARSPRPGGRARPDLGAAVYFLAAAVAVPLVILTLNRARTLTASEIVVPAVCWVVLAAVIGLLGLHRPGRRRPVVEHALAALAGGALLVGVLRPLAHYSQPGWLSQHRAQMEQIALLHDTIARHIQQRGLRHPIISVTTIASDYLHPQVTEVVLYERYGLLCLPRAGLGYGVLAVPEADALAVAGASDLLVVVRPARAVYPFDESMVAILPQLHALGQRQFVCLGVFHIRGDEITLYVRSVESQMNAEERR
jgi:hypothetical protein